MNNHNINATPTKEFFISALVRDIDLNHAIIDLVDNCIDGARRVRGEGDLDGLFVHLEVNQNSFCITDNCGGISVDTARNYAFRFGRPESIQTETHHAIGQFGIGMKRAIFKLGQKFKVESTTAHSQFVIAEDVTTWQARDDWAFEFEELAENLNMPADKWGTKITVTELHESVADDFSLVNFLTKLHYDIADAHLYSLQKNLEIKLNSNKLRVRSLKLLQSEDVQPVNKELTLWVNELPVQVRIYAGVVAEANGKYKPEESGWYIFCNGRLVVKADRTNLTGWGERNGTAVPAFHYDFAPFRGYVFFEAEQASLLPWNTTKTGLDTNAGIFRKVRSEMILVMSPILTFIRQWREETRSEELASENSAEISAKIVVEEAKNVTLQQINMVRPVFTVNITSPSAVRKAKDKLINYYKTEAQVKEVQEILGAKTLREVGEKTFEYFYRREVESE